MARCFYDNYDEVGYADESSLDDNVDRIYDMYYSCGFSIPDIARKLRVSCDYVEDVIGYGVE